MFTRAVIDCPIIARDFDIDMWRRRNRHELVKPEVVRAPHRLVLLLLVWCRGSAKLENVLMDQNEFIRLNHFDWIINDLTKLVYNFLLV